jgi:capsular polysaccharide biosynthesis protein
VMAASLLVAAGAYLVGSALSKVYQSSGVIRVTVLSQQGISDPVVTAGNDLASQIAQLADAQPVIDMAARSLGLRAGDLSDKINGSTLGAQNLVQVTATGSSPDSAMRRSTAATMSLAGYQQSLNASAVNQYLATVQAALVPLQSKIQGIYARIATDSPTLRAADTLQLETLLTTRSQVIGQVSRDAASSRPYLQAVSYSSAPSVVYPKPALYALVAFLVALILAGRLAFTVVSRRTRQ